MGKFQDPKRCPRCEQYKPRKEYYRRKGFKNAVTSWCKLCCNDSHKDWYLKNREYDIATSNAWRKANPEWAKKQQRDWKSKNRDKRKESYHRRRAHKLHNGVFKISVKDMRRLTGPCVYCGSVENITMDHVIPISRGGSHGIGNLVPACSSCNNRKLDKTVMEWKTGKSRPYKV